MGACEEGTGGAVEGTLERDVVGQVLAPLLERRPIGPNPAHVLPQDLGRLERRQRSPRGDLLPPVLPFEPLAHVPCAARIRPQLGWIHGAQYSPRSAATHS